MKKNFLLIFVFSLTLSANTFAQNGNPGPGACASGGKNPSVMNGNGVLGPTYNNSACGLNYVQASKLIETRSAAYGFNTNGSGLPATFTIAGIPAGATIVQAYVWYLVSYLAASPQTSSVVLTNPVPATYTIASTMIGQDQSKCWGETGTANYRADVTAAISGNGNYTLNIAGITGSSGNFPNWYDQIDGATLFIIYQDNAATYLGSIVLWDGDMTGVGNTYTQTMTGINVNPCGNPLNANAFLIVSDMQDNVNSNMHPSTLNGTTITTFPNDFYNFDFTNTTVTSGQTTSNFGTDGLGSDCFDWAMMGLYYQNPSCTPVTLTVTPTNSTCGNPNGAASASASGAPPPYTYVWSTGATTTSISNLAAGNYTVSVTDATGCSTVQTFSIATSVGPNVTFTSTPVLCNGGSTGSATLTASGGTAPYTYSWVLNPVQATPTATGLAAGTYSVQVGDASGCSNTYTVTVTQPTALTATASVVNNALCFGSSDGSAIANPAGGTTPYAYNWNPTGQNTQTASGLSAGTYSVVVTDANGCTIPQSATITQPVAITLSATSTIASCGLSDGTATVSAVGGTGAYSYLWLGVNPAQTTQTLNNVPAGNYNAVVTDANGCNTVLSVTVPTAGPPVAMFINDPELVNLLDASIQFTDLSANATSWQWDFGDPLNPTTGSDQNPNHTYTDTGTYCITLVVTDPGGVCMDTTVHCIRVEAPFTFYAPNAFTPNGDVFNPVFSGVGTYIKEYKMWIYDRWGNLTWSCHTYGEPQLAPDCIWDGKVRRGGQIIQEDVYVWKVEITDANNIEHKYIGQVSMIK